MTELNTTNEIISFYIPRISTDYTCEDVIYTFSLAFIGYVKRVDFTPIKKDGNTPDTRFQSAFVHLNYLYDSQIASDIYTATYSCGGKYKLWPATNIFWLLLKNHKPISDTNLNIHQVVENARILEETVLQHEETIQEQYKIMEKQGELIMSQGKELDNYGVQINRIKETIHNMLFSTYDEKTNMKEIYLRYNYLMYGQICDTKWLSTHEDVYQRIGDNTDKSCKDNESYSSMPSLVSMSDASDLSKERMKFSAEYCDNL